MIDIALFAAAALFLFYVWRRWFGQTERKESDKLISKKVTLNMLRQRKEDLSETLGVTQEAVSLQKEIDKVEKDIEKLERA